MSAPQVSVVTTVRNGGDLLAETAASVRSQSDPAWEWVVVDDGSTDDTLAFLAALARDDSRVRVVPTSGIGRGAALNRALAACRGAWVANADADDPLHPRRLERQLAAVTREPGYDALGSDFVLIAGSATPEWPALASDPAPVRDVTGLVTSGNPLSHSTMLMRREALEQVSGYDEGRRSQLDYDLWVRLAAAGRRLGRLEEVLAAKRLHDAQSFETGRRVRYLLGAAEVQARAIRDLDGGLADRALLYGRFVYGLLPRAVRSAGRRLS